MFLILRIMTSANRVLSIDIMRGLTLVLMLFVNDLFMPGVPAWLGHTAAMTDGMGLADWVFPGFMFMVGMSIPYSVGSRRKKGETDMAIVMHILIRTASLLITGVLMSNSRAVNAVHTGISKNIWSMIMYTGVFLVWFNYKPGSRNKWLKPLLQLAGAAMIIVMVIIFKGRGGSAFRFNDWGILGIIGWGYLTAALTYMWWHDNIWGTAGVMLLFLVLNILAKLHLPGFLYPLYPVLGVVLEGNAPFIVISGMLTTLILRNYLSGGHTRPLLIISAMGVLSIAAGFILRNWIIISKILGTPTWALICNGISMLLFALIYLLTDIRHHARWGAPFRPAGANSLTIYLVPDMFYYIIWQLNLPLLIYKTSSSSLIVAGGSLLWAAVMGIGLAILLEKINFRLKL